MERAQDFNIVLDDVAITELTFGKEYAAAVEAKQVCTFLCDEKLIFLFLRHKHFGFVAKFRFLLRLLHKRAQRAQFWVERAKQEKQQKIVQAEGEADAARLVRQRVFDIFFVVEMSASNQWWQKMATILAWRIWLEAKIIIARATTASLILIDDSKWLCWTSIVGRMLE